MEKSRLLRISEENARCKELFAPKKSTLPLVIFTASLALALVLLLPLLTILRHLDFRKPNPDAIQHIRLAEAYRKHAEAEDRECIDFTEQASLGTRSSMYPGGPYYRPETWKFKADQARRSADHFRYLADIEEKASRKVN